MKVEWWRQIERVWEEALLLPAGERDAFLAGACGSDEELRAEVAALLAAHDVCGRFLEEPAIMHAAALLLLPHTVWPGPEGCNAEAGLQRATAPPGNPDPAAHPGVSDGNTG